MLSVHLIQHGRLHTRTKQSTLVEPDHKHSWTQQHNHIWCLGSSSSVWACCAKPPFFSGHFPGQCGWHCRSAIRATVIMSLPARTLRETSICHRQRLHPKMVWTLAWTSSSFWGLVWCITAMRRMHQTEVVCFQGKKGKAQPNMTNMPLQKMPVSKMEGKKN